VDDDLFGPVTLGLTRPARLCLPVDVDGSGIENPGLGLTCYQATAARGTPRFTVIGGVGVETRFGPEQLDVTRRDQLCVPSTIEPASP
jgi:hypothetical protein